MVRALDGLGARWEDRGGTAGCRRVVPRLNPGGEQNTLRAASLCRWETRRETGARHDSIARMPIGVEEKQFVAHLCTLCQKTLSLEMEPGLGEKRSAPYRRMSVTRDVASLWHRYGAPCPRGAKVSNQSKGPLG